MGNGTGAANWLGHLEAYQQALRLGQLEGYRQRRWQRSCEFSTWLDQSTLPGLTMEHALALYCASGGGRTGEFKTNPIEEVRDSLDFLNFDIKPQVTDDLLHQLYGWLMIRAVLKEEYVHLHNLTSVMPRFETHPSRADLVS